MLENCINDGIGVFFVAVVPLALCNSNLLKDCECGMYDDQRDDVFVSIQSSALVMFEQMRSKASQRFRGEGD